MKPRVYVRHITRNTTNEKAPFCLPEKALGKLGFLHVNSALVKYICLITRKV